MSKQQYDLTTKTNYLTRKMFLDPEGPVTIQRFEEVNITRFKRLNRLLEVFSGCRKRLA